MAKYKGKTLTVDHAAQHVSDKFSDLTVLETLKNQLPQDTLEQVGGDIAFEKQAIVINTKQLGAVRFAVKERTPEKVLFASEGTPVPLQIEVDLDEKTPGQTEVGTAIDVEIPAMLKPFIGPQMQKMADMLSEVIGKVASV